MEETINEKLGAVPNLSSALSSNSRVYTEPFKEFLAYTTWSSVTEAYGSSSHALEPMNDLGVHSYNDIDWVTSPLLLNVYFPNDIGSSYFGNEGYGTMHYSLDEIRIGFCSKSNNDGSAYFYDNDAYDWNFTQYISYFDYNTSQEVPLNVGSQRFMYFKSWQASGFGVFSINPKGLSKNRPVTPFKKNELGIGIIPIYRYQGLVNSGTRNRNLQSQTFTKYDI